MTIAADLMTSNPTTVRETSTVASAVQVLQALDVRHLPVVNSDGEIVGMLSDRDLRSLTVPHIVNDEWLSTIQRALDARVATVMSSDAVTVDTETDAKDIVELMLEHKIGAVPVVDAERVVVGVISYVDVLRALPVAS